MEERKDIGQLGKETEERKRETWGDTDTGKR